VLGNGTCHRVTIGAPSFEANRGQVLEGGRSQELPSKSVFAGIEFVYGLSASAGKTAVTDTMNDGQLKRYYKVPAGKWRIFSRESRIA